MNERIRELAEQAEIILWFSEIDFETNIAGKESALEKFAELIVQECVRVLIVGEGNEKTVDAIWDLEELGIDVSKILNSINQQTFRS